MSSLGQKSRDKSQVDELVGGEILRVDVDQVSLRLLAQSAIETRA